ncbi:MAG: hypothetical protein Q8O88_03680 [bacterium]|nr:hypothetical protein [bacterium]
MAKKKQPKQKKLYKTTVTVEILSEEKLSFNDLQDLHEQITDGSNSGVCKQGKTIILKGKDAVKATIAQGSDPEFFFMDNDGNVLESELE